MVPMGHKILIFEDLSKSIIGGFPKPQVWRQDLENDVEMLPGLQKWPQNDIKKL